MPLEAVAGAVVLAVVGWLLLPIVKHERAWTIARKEAQINSWLRRVREMEGR